jgi:hypothetical protein
VDPSVAVLAVSSTSIVCPTSFGLTVYVVPVPPFGEHVGVHVSHWSVTVTAGSSASFQMPHVTVSIWPCWAVPLILGSAGVVLVGTASATPVSTQQVTAPANRHSKTRTP